MEFKSIYTREIREAREHVNFLYKLQYQERLDFVKSLLDKGWKTFVFESEYYGSHGEYGEGDIRYIYLISPEVFATLPKFDESDNPAPIFSHGHHGQSNNNDLWDEWFDSIPESEFFELETNEEIALVK